MLVIFFFFNDTATTEIYTLSLHDALPIWPSSCRPAQRPCRTSARTTPGTRSGGCCTPPRRESPQSCAVTNGDRKSTRLNSSHANISYAVFCLKKKNKRKPHTATQKNRNNN